MISAMWQQPKDFSGTGQYQRQQQPVPLRHQDLQQRQQQSWPNHQSNCPQQQQQPLLQAMPQQMQFNQAPQFQQRNQLLQPSYQAIQPQQQQPEQLSTQYFENEEYFEHLLQPESVQHQFQAQMPQQQQYQQQQPALQTDWLAQHSSMQQQQPVFYAVNNNAQDGFRMPAPQPPPQQPLLLLPPQQPTTAAPAAAQPHAAPLPKPSGQVNSASTSVVKVENGGQSNEVAKRSEQPPQMPRPVRPPPPQMTPSADQMLQNRGQVMLALRPSQAMGVANRLPADQPALFELVGCLTGPAKPLRWRNIISDSSLPVADNNNNNKTSVGEWDFFLRDSIGGGEPLRCVYFEMDETEDDNQARQLLLQKQAQPQTVRCVGQICLSQTWFQCYSVRVCSQNETGQHALCRRKCETDWWKLFQQD
uniref:Med13_N domain-containing protein n=2 Tax=Macrostomum lignano TaxID=282301 RepID=A0A1I8GI16_9PLAT